MPSLPSDSFMNWMFKNKCRGDIPTRLAREHIELDLGETTDLPEELVDRLYEDELIDFDDEEDN